MKEDQFDAKRSKGKISSSEKKELQEQFKQKVPYWSKLYWQVPSNIWNDIRMQSKEGFLLLQKFLAENKPLVMKANGNNFNVIKEFQISFQNKIQKCKEKDGEIIYEMIFQQLKRRIQQPFQQNQSPLEFLNSNCQKIKKQKRNSADQNNIGFFQKYLRPYIQQKKTSLKNLFFQRGLKSQNAQITTQAQVTKSSQNKLEQQQGISCIQKQYILIRKPHIKKNQSIQTVFEKLKSINLYRNGIKLIKILQKDFKLQEQKIELDKLSKHQYFIIEVDSTLSDSEIYVRTILQKLNNQIPNSELNKMLSQIILIALINPSNNKENKDAEEKQSKIVEQKINQFKKNLALKQDLKNDKVYIKEFNCKKFEKLKSQEAISNYVTRLFDN